MDSELQNWQIAFTDYLLNPADNSDIVENKLRVVPVSRLAIYRNNIRYRLIETLKIVYPNIIKLIGEDCFKHLANVYVDRYPTTDGNIFNYGKYFAEFVKNYHVVKELVYLSEVAQLEWACHEIYIAPDHEALDLAKLSKVSADNYGHIKFKLHPACRIFNFNYPILAIWNLCQGENSENSQVNLDDGGIKLLAVRRDLEIVFEKLNPAEFVMLDNISQGKIFLEACEAALAIDADFDVGAFLRKEIVNHTLVGFKLN